MAKQPYIPPALREAVIARDGTVCRYCGVTVLTGRTGKGQGGPDQLCLDHVTPVYLGGATTLDNLVVACRQCNCIKGHRTFMAPAKARGRKVKR